MITQLTSLVIGAVGVGLGATLGYFARQSIAKKQIGTLEERIEKRTALAKQEAENLVAKARQDSTQILEKIRKEEKERREAVLKAEKLLLEKESGFQKGLSDLEENKKEVFKKADEIKELKENLNQLIKQEIDKLEKIAGLGKEQAKEVLLEKVERDCQKDVLEKMIRLEQQGQEKVNEKAKEMIAIAIQRYALPQAQDTTTTTITLPSDKIKGRIIGKEGRNIKAFEKATGVEVLVDETPEVITISSFNPFRRYVAQKSMERLIEDGRIQPARIEEIVKKMEEEAIEKAKKAGETAVYETGVLDLPPRMIELLGRLRFRTSFGQNVLLHSIEVSLLSGMLAEEIGADVKIAKKAGLLHDIGKAVDHQVQGSHVDIGIKILEKFNVEQEIIDAMKSHHEEYPYSTLESRIVQAADQISGARPGARKDTLENYLKRLEDLENVATSFEGVKKAYAIQAGRELRVFVSPEEVDDLTAHKLAKEISERVAEELNYPGEIKVIVIREKRVIEYAR